MELVSSLQQRCKHLWKMWPWFTRCILLFHYFLYGNPCGKLIKLGGMRWGRWAKGWEWNERQSKFKKVGMQPNIRWFKESSYKKLNATRYTPFLYLVVDNNFCNWHKIIPFLQHKTGLLSKDLKSMFKR